jgi:hypothetical protein
VDSPIEHRKSVRRKEMPESMRETVYMPKTNSKTPMQELWEMEEEIRQIKEEILTREIGMDCYDMMVM